jgi:hypothetical protein
MPLVLAVEAAYAEARRDRWDYRYAFGYRC